MKTLPGWWLLNKEPNFEWVSKSCFDSVSEWVAEYDQKFVVDEESLTKEFCWVLSKSRDEMRALAHTNGDRVSQNIEQDISERLAGACLRMLKERELNQLFVKRRISGFLDLFSCEEESDFILKMNNFLESPEGLLGWLKEGCFNDFAARVACEICELGYRPKKWLEEAGSVAIRTVKVENKLNLDSMYRLAFGDDGLVKMFDQTERYLHAAEVGGLRYAARLKGVKKEKVQLDMDVL